MLMPFIVIQASFIVWWMLSITYSVIRPNPIFNLLKLSTQWSSNRCCFSITQTSGNLHRKYAMYLSICWPIYLMSSSDNRRSSDTFRWMMEKYLFSFVNIFAVFFAWLMMYYCIVCGRLWTSYLVCVMALLHRLLYTCGFV